MRSVHVRGVSPWGQYQSKKLQPAAGVCPTTRPSTEYRTPPPASLCRPLYTHKHTHAVFSLCFLTHGFLPFPAGVIPLIGLMQLAPPPPPVRPHPAAWPSPAGRPPRIQQRLRIQIRCLRKHTQIRIRLRLHARRRPSKTPGCSERSTAVAAPKPAGVGGGGWGVAG